MSLPPTGTSETRLPSFLRLAGIATTASMAAGCREAWRSFVDTSQEWGKADLLSWTYGMLAPLTRLTDDARTGAAVHHDFERVDVRFVDRLLRTARARVLDTLWSFETAEARIDFGYAMLGSGAVVPCEDARGLTGFVPTRGAGPLAERVLSLVAADLLTSPEDFEHEIMCTSCGSVRIGPKPCCAVPRRASRLYLGEEPPTLRFAR